MAEIYKLYREWQWKNDSDTFTSSYLTESVHAAAAIHDDWERALKGKVSAGFVQVSGATCREGEVVWKELRRTVLS